MKTLRSDDHDVLKRIEIDPLVCGGQPVIRGTRIPISVILEQLAQGESWDSLLKGYPELRRTDIKACLDYARHAVLHTDLNEQEAA
jgi:uncharacterized protein (DUF433 family)